MEHGITIGEWLVSGTAVMASLATIILVEVSLKLAKVTTLAANAEMSKVARNADDDMRDVALGHIAPHDEPAARPLSGESS